MSDDRFYIASDYAGVVGGKHSFYYGYEEVAGGRYGEEWCFVAKTDGAETLRVPASKLVGKPEPFECAECLLAGIAMWLRRNTDAAA